MDFIQSLAARLAWAPTVVATAPWAGAKAHLYTNDMTPLVTSVEADFTEADFGGYAEQPITWGTAYINQTADVIVPSNTLEWISTGAPGNMVFGIYVLGAGGEFLGAARLDNPPVSIPAAGFGLSLDIQAAF
jgi:hypothetical protein